jgi:putative chitinase
MTVTIGQLKEATCSTGGNATKFLPYIIQTFNKYEINTPIRQLCFLAQVGHESGGLFYTEELASGTAYEGRLDLGNTQPGDGKKFKGRGLIQITGRANYKTISADWGIDLIANPSLLGGKNSGTCTPEQLKNAALSAGWFWNKKNLNVIADKINIALPIDKGENLKHFISITKTINGGTNGLADRLNRYKKGVAFF